jgi:electron transport complex protein RnfE
MREMAKEKAGAEMQHTGIAVVREVLGTGKIADVQMMPAAYPSWVIMVLPPGAFLAFGLPLALVNWIDSTRSNKKG